MAENKFGCPIYNYSKWAEYNDYWKYAENMKCECVVSKWSEWSECKDSFGPGSVKVEERSREVCARVCFVFGS